jgi:prolyl-tRNA synthetase
VEQNNDKDGAIWPKSIAPFGAAVIPVNSSDESQMKTAHKIYDEGRMTGMEMILDDREQRVGVKLKDIDLMGIPIKIIVGKALKEGKIEVKLRKTGETRLVAVEKALEEVRALLA